MRAARLRRARAEPCGSGSHSHTIPTCRAAHSWTAKRRDVRRHLHEEPNRRRAWM